VHGDAEGTDILRRSLTGWLQDMHLVQAHPVATIDRYIGYYEPYATSHDALDRDEAMQAETRNAALALLERVRQIRLGRYERADAGLEAPRKK